MLLAEAASTDTEVSYMRVDRDEATGEPEIASLTIHDKTMQDSLGWVSLACTADGLFSPRTAVDVLAFGTRPAERQTNTPAETVRLRIDDAPYRQVKVDVIDHSGDDDMAPYTGTLDLPFLPVEAREFVGELALGRRLIAQIGDVRPVVRVDLAAARPDIVEFKNACDRMHGNFQRSPQRWAAIWDHDVDPFTDRGRVRLQLRHETSHDGGQQPMLFVQCRNDNDRRGVDVILLVPPKLHDGDVPPGTQRGITMRFDSATAQRVALKATGRSMADDVWWDTSELPPDEQPSQGLLSQLRSSGTLVVEGFSLPPLRFNLAGGRTAIAEFAAACNPMLD